MVLSGVPLKFPIHVPPKLSPIIPHEEHFLKPQNMMSYQVAPFTPPPINQIIEGPEEITPSPIFHPKPQLPMTIKNKKEEPEITMEKTGRPTGKIEKDTPDHIISHFVFKFYLAFRTLYNGKKVHFL